MKPHYILYATSLLLLAGCKTAPAPGLVRVAVLPFDNLTGDDTLQWIANALPTIVATQLTGATNSISLRGTAQRDTVSADAARVVHGYFDRRKGALHFEVSIEDTATHTMVQTLSLDGDVLQAGDRVAHAVDAKARPFPTSNGAALEAWGKHDFEKAVALDPDFGTAWLEWSQSLGSKEAALPKLDEAVARTSLRGEIEQKQIALLRATLKSDDKDRSQQEVALVALLPNDPDLPRTLAEQELNARQFQASVKLFQEAISRAPDNPSNYNLLGYAQFYTGDVKGAEETFARYARFAGQDANAADSTGEVLFMAGRYAEAEKQFLLAHDRNPAMLGGADLSKAAYAHWLAGDLPGADAIFQRSVKFRTEHGDQTGAWRQAVWLYATGRSDQAMAALQSEIAKPSTPAAQQLAQRQLLVWQNLDKMTGDLATLEKGYRATPPGGDSLLRLLYAQALVKAGRLQEAQPLIQWSPLPETGDPLLQGSLFPIYQQLTKQLPKSGPPKKG